MMGWHDDGMACPRPRVRRELEQAFVVIRGQPFSVYPPTDLAAGGLG
jgi:hypothetical protein